MIETRLAPITLTSMWRIFFVFIALLSILPAHASHAGQYERAKDGKTIVWNDEPQAGDAAAWFGDRDKEGYATGVGELTWYTGDGELFARYFGKMERGKFQGAVNVHSRGKTAHAVFDDGKRIGAWIPGRATLADRRKPADAKKLSTVAKTENAPAEQRPKPNLAKMMADAPAEGPPPQIATKSPAAPAKTPGDQPKQPFAKAQTEERSPSAVTKTESLAKSDTGSNNENSKPEVSDFLGPPATLRNDPVVETPSTAPEPDLAASPSASAQLTTDEAVAIADSEARARGFDLNRYGRPTADYSKVKGKWSLVYQLKDHNGDAPPHFNVTVDDHTKKVDIRQ